VRVSDDKGNLWTLAASVNNGQVTSSVYIATNVAAGTDQVTVQFDGALYGCQFVLSEFYNVAAASSIDATSTNATSVAPSVSAGSMVPRASGDLIYNYGYDEANASLQPGGTLPVSSIAAGSRFSLLSADVFLGDFAQYYIQPTATQITPTASVSGGADKFNSVAVALRPAVQGTPPKSGIRIVHVSHFMVTKTTPIIFPSVGNLLLFATTRPAYGETNAIDYSAVSSTPANTWVKTDQTAIPPGYGPAQVWYATNANSSLNETINVTGVPGPYGTTFVMYDVANAGGYDTAAGRPASAMTTSSPTESFSGFSQITPSGPGELVFAFLANSFGPNISVSPGIMDTVLYGGQIDADLMDNADGYAHVYASGTSPISFAYKMNSGGNSQSVERGIAIAFKPSASPTPTPIPTPTPSPSPSATPTPTPSPAPTPTPKPTPTPQPTPSSATLAWNADPSTGNASTNAAGYHLRIGTASKTYTQSIDTKTSTSQVVSNLTSGTQYYFAVTAYNAQGTDSPFSNEVAWTAP
jgi:hypothetical protein